MSLSPRKEKIVQYKNMITYEKYLSMKDIEREVGYISFRV